MARQLCSAVVAATMAATLSGLTSHVDLYQAPPIDPSMCRPQLVWLSLDLGEQIAERAGRRLKVELDSGSR